MTRLTPAHYFLFLGLSIFVLLLVILVSPGIGTESGRFGLFDAWRSFISDDDQSHAYRVGFALRLPRTLLAAQAGMTLGLCGAVFQTLFRNPLATPYTLGVASGGSLGALIAIKAGFDFSWFGLSGVSTAAFIGALAVIGVVFLFTRGVKRLSVTELLLAGVTLGLFCSAMTMFVQYLSTERQTFAMIRWMMGSVVTIGLSDSLANLPLLLVSWIMLISCAKALNQYALGEELAVSRGVNVVRLQVVCIVFASLATAAVVAACGPIGFVGLVVPQMTGLLVGRDCRILLPASALLGGTFLALCDWISQLALGWLGALTGHALSSASLPTGVVTAIVGVPIFLVLLYRRAR